MNPDAAKEIVRRFYHEAISERDASAREYLLAVGSASGQVVEYFLAAFPDLEHELTLILAEGDLVVAHQRWAGTHGGEFMGFAPSGNQVEFTSTAILRIEGDRIAQAWDELDAAALTAQFG